MKKIMIFVFILLIFSCATTGQLMRIRLDMTRPQVVSAMGDPTAFRGAITNKYDELIEVWEYALYKTDDDAFLGRPTFYWLYFSDGILVQWGQAGDWQREVDRIYEIRFNK